MEECVGLKRSSDHNFIWMYVYHYFQDGLEQSAHAQFGYDSFNFRPRKENSCMHNDQIFGQVIGIGNSMVSNAVADNLAQVSL